MEQAIVGTATVSAGFTSNVATLTLTNTNALQDARALCLDVTATLTAAGTLNVPAIQKPYVVFNNTSGGFALTVKVSGQTGVSVPNGKKTVLYNNGTDVGEQINYLSGLTLGSALGAASGGTGLTTPGTAGNVLTSNGTAWTSSTPTTGTVSTVSVVSANGLAGTVATATSTPAITLSTTITGVLKGNGTAISAATSGTDYLAPPSGTALLKANSGGALANATAGTDYLAPPSGTEILKANSGGALANATAGTDYSAGTSALATGILKSTTTTGALTIAVSGTDYAPATSGSAVLKGNGSGGFSTATAGTDYVAPGTATTFTAKQTFTGAATVIGASLQAVLEKMNVVASAATGTIDFNINTSVVWYYTTSASANWTVNIRGDASNSLDSLMAVGESLTCAFLVTQGATAYYNSAVQVDGSAVTPKWQGGSAPTSGNASGIDTYTYTVIKTAAATFTVLASQTQFA